MRRLFLALLLGGALPVQAAPRPKVPRPTAEVALSSDSAYIAVRWAQVVDARGNPVVRYLTQLRVAGAVRVADSTAVLADTLVLPRPLAGDSLVVEVAVAARDVRGLLSAWGTTKVTVRGKPWQPPFAPVPQADTLATRPDSIRPFAINKELDADGTYHITVGESTQLCALLYFGTRAELDGGCAALGLFVNPEVLREAWNARGWNGHFATVAAR